MNNNHKAPGEIALVFDFGNVLLNWDPLLLYGKFFDGDLERAKKFLDEIGFHAWNLQLDAGRPFAQAVDELCAQFPQYCELIRAYDERWVKSLGGSIQPVVEIVNKLHEHGHHLYALSNWSAEKFYLVRHLFPFMSVFKEIVLSGEVGLLKPDRRIFEILLQRIGRPTGECLFIDDAPANVQAAQALGMQTVHYVGAVELLRSFDAYGLKLISPHGS